MVRLVIRTPFITKIAAAGWNSNAVPGRRVPKGSLSWIMSRKVKVAMMAEEVKQANGMGVPSKYFDLPVASLGNMLTVTLKRASRVRPHKT